HRFQTAADMEAAVRRLHGGAHRVAAQAASARALTPTATDPLAAVARGASSAVSARRASTLVSARCASPVVAPRRPRPAAPPGGRAGAALLARRPRARSRQRARPAPRPVVAARSAALGVCALALASAALVLALAQRWLPGGDRPAPTPPAAQARSAVR